MSYDSKKFNVLIRGKHTLFVLAQMDGKRKRDVDKLRLQIANMLSVEAKAVVPNHDYDGLPEGKWFCFRFKGQIPARIRRPSIEADRHLFCAKVTVLNFVDETKPVHKTDAVLETMPGTEDEPMREGDTPTLPPISSSDITMLLMQRQMAQDELLTKILENQQYLAEIVGQMALKL